MKFAIWFLLTLVPAIATAGDETLGAVEFPCTLAPGQVYELAFQRSQSKAGDGILESDASIENAVRFEVIEQNERGFVLAWSAEWSDVQDMLDNLPLEGTEWISETLDRVSKHQLMIQTDEFGSPIGLLNQEETIALFGDIIQRMVDEFEVGDEERAAMQQTLESVMSPEFVVSRSMQDATLYFMFTGGSYELGIDYTVNDFLQSPLGGDPIPCLINFRVDSVDELEGIANIVYEQVTDADAAKGVLAEFFSRALDGDEVMAAIEDAEMGIFTEAAFEMDLTTGMPRELWFERRIDMGPAQRTDRFEVRTVGGE